MSLVYNPQGRVVGTISIEYGRKVYCTERDGFKGQVFRTFIHNGVAVGCDILRQLIQSNVDDIRFIIKNLTPETPISYYEISLQDFLAGSERIHFDNPEQPGKYGTQRVMSLNKMKRYDPQQKVLLC